MLTTVEKILFTLLALGSLYAAIRAIERIVRIVRRGSGSLATDHFVSRLVNATIVFITMKTVVKKRPLASLAHLFVAWGFTFYLLVNVIDGWRAFFGGGPVSFDPSIVTVDDIYRLIADVLTVGVLVGMIALLVRRGLRGQKIFGFNKNTVLHPKALFGIKRDSLIVGLFILFHVGSRFAGEVVRIAIGNASALQFNIGGLASLQWGDPWQPFASALANLLVSRAPAYPWWTGPSFDLMFFLEHLFFWFALGSILLFVPYFLYSKHIHLFIAPLNFMLKPERKSIGQLDKIDFDDQSIEVFGASKLEQMTKTALLDAYACIMCNRCQDVCPANATGKVLSPSALEINKRYQLNQEGGSIAAGKESSSTLIEFAISPEAVWACTTCGACVEVCPVNNEPMRDILDIRRSLVLMDNSFPTQFQAAFKGMERSGNPWGISSDSRLDWAKGLTVPTIEQNPSFEILWWVGCAPATDARAQKTARDFAKILNAAGVNFAVLGKMERCTGDSARRSGNEALFFELATGNVETLNEVKPKRIVTTCPHCLHTLANEYPAFSGNYAVIHHTQLIEELLAQGKLQLHGTETTELTFHDPCYLGRHNDVYDAPRQVLYSVGAEIIEMDRNRNNSFCCGAGGAQMWKEEEHGTERVSANRIKEAIATGKDTLAVGCPFCMIMLTDAAKAEQTSMQIKDVAEIVAEKI